MITVDSGHELQEMLEFLHGEFCKVASSFMIMLDGELHQNVVTTLPAQFKQASPPKRALKRVFHKLFDQHGTAMQPQHLRVLPKTNLNMIRIPNTQQGQPPMKQIRIVGQKPGAMMKTVRLVKSEGPSGGRENFVPYGKLYRTVLKNGKAIQTPVVTPGTTDLKYKTSEWQKQRQLQVTQGTTALNGRGVTRKQILTQAVHPVTKKTIDINQNSEVKAEPIDDDDVAEVVEFDDRPLTEVLQHNSNGNNNRNNQYSSDEDNMAVIDCSTGNGTDMVTYEGHEEATTIESSEKRVRPPYSVLPRRHVCNICDKKFVRPAELERHFRIHTGEKPFKCSICDQEFTRKCHLTKHMITHDNKQYYCTMCKFKTIRPDTFRRHLKDHTRFVEQNSDASELNQLTQVVKLNFYSFLTFFTLGCDSSNNH